MWYLVEHRDFNLPWTGNRLIEKPLPTKDSTLQKNVDIYSYLERDSNPRTVEDYTCFRPRPLSYYLLI